MLSRTDDARNSTHSRQLLDRQKCTHATSSREHVHSIIYICTFDSSKTSFRQGINIQQYIYTANSRGFCTVKFIWGMRNWNVSTQIPTATGPAAAKDRIRRAETDGKSSRGIDADDSDNRASCPAPPTGRSVGRWRTCGGCWSDPSVQKRPTLAPRQ